MSNQWFRMYAEFLNDPKVQMMSEVMQRRLVMLFCARCNGSETFHDEEITFLLRVSMDEWLATKAEFVTRKFIDKDNKILNWNKRQFVSDSSTARVSRHRAKKKQKCNVSVTPPDTEQNRTEQNRIILKSSVPKPEDVSQETFDDFIRQRKTKFTNTALKGIRREAEKAGWTMELALSHATMRGWQSFKADWVKESKNGKNKSADDITAEVAAEYYIREPEDGPDQNAGSPKLQYFQ
jgi:hypothetical protein